MKNYSLIIDEKGYRHALASFLGRLLGDGLVGAILAPRDSEAGKNVVMSLVKSAEALQGSNPFAPVAAVNAARIVSDLTATAAPGEKIGVLLRSCESRALLELAKFNQAKLDNILIIGMDCLGTFDPVEYSRLCGPEGKTTEAWMAAAAGRNYPEEMGGRSVRRACRACGHVEAENASIHLGWVGMEQSGQLLVSVTGEFADWASSFMGAGNEAIPDGRRQAITSIRLRREENKKRLYQEFSSLTGNIQSMKDIFSGCIKCYNCRRVCPLCFCRECVFSTDILKHHPEFFLSRAERKGIVGMPADKLLFHLTRLNHMALSCVGCGQCESACPSNLPLGIIFKMAGERLQRLFDYVPGRAIDEEPPLTTYRESELEPR